MHSEFIHRDHSVVTDINNGSDPSQVTKHRENSLNGLCRELWRAELTFMVHILVMTFEGTFILNQTIMTLLNSISVHPEMMTYYGIMSVKEVLLAQWWKLFRVAGSGSRRH